MEQKRNIEKAVSTYFKVPVKDLYSGKHNTYPYSGARPVLAWLLYKNGMKIYDIEWKFGVSNRQAFNLVAKVQTALKSDTKMRQDVEEINKLLSK